MSFVEISPIIGGIFLFFVGAALGSFLNVAALRLISGEDFLFSRSHCAHCRHVLRWYELVPVISFLALGGKCLNCRSKISFRYLLVEIAMGLYLLLLGYWGEPAFAFPNFALLLGGAWAFYLDLFLYAALGVIAGVIFLVDFDTSFIVVSLTRPAAVAGFLLMLLDSYLAPAGGFFHAVSAQTLAVGATALFFWLIHAVTSGKGMGLGDAELALALGFFLPFPLVLIMTLFSFWIGAVVGIVLVFFFGYSGKSQIPFGPFLVLGFLAALFWGQSALSYFLPLV